MNDTTITKKRTRTRTTHSKGGCITCKVRHLKCDQVKPKCMRCSKAGWECDGYAPPKPPRKPTRQIRVLAPKDIENHHNSPLPVPAIRSHFRDEREFQCFNAFRVKVAIPLVSFIDDNLWGYVVFQTAESDSPVTQAAIAFGAWSSAETLECNREYAFAEYGKALSFLRHALSNTTEKEIPTRQVVVTLLLCVNFEVLAGFEESATQLTAIGINFLQNTILKNTPVLEIACLRSSPMSHDFEHDMIDDSCSTALHDLYMQCGQYTVESIPGISSALKETYMYLGLLVRQSWHHLAYMEPFVNFTALEQVTTNPVDDYA